MEIGSDQMNEGIGPSEQNAGIVATQPTSPMKGGGRGHSLSRRAAPKGSNQQPNMADGRDTRRSNSRKSRSKSLGRSRHDLNVEFPPLPKRPVEKSNKGVEVAIGLERVEASTAMDKGISYTEHQQAPRAKEQGQLQDMLEAANPMFNSCLVGYFVGKKLPFKLSESILRKTWGNQLKEMMANEDGFYFLHIPDGEFRQHIIERGHIMLSKVPMILKQWHPLVKLQKGQVDSLPVWVRLRNLPYSLWSPLSFGRIASKLGKPLYVDRQTESMKMLSYARICVEVSAKRPFKTEIPIVFDGQTLMVQAEYEWRPVSCKLCGVFGHPDCDGTAAGGADKRGRRVNPPQEPNLPRGQSDDQDVRRARNGPLIK